MATLSGAYTGTSSATPILRRSVLVKCPLFPALNAHIPVIDDWMKNKKGKARSVKRALGRAVPVVLRGVEEGDAFSVSFLCIAADYAKLVELIDANQTLLIQDEKQQWYVEVADDVSISEHLFDGAEDDAWQVTVPFVEVDMP